MFTYHYLLFIAPKRAMAILAEAASVSHSTMANCWALLPHEDGQPQVYGRPAGELDSASQVVVPFMGGAGSQPGYWRSVALRFLPTLVWVSGGLRAPFLNLPSHDAQTLVELLIFQNPKNQSLSLKQRPGILAVRLLGRSVH